MAIGATKSDVEKYMLCLNDPFNHGPVRLGAGCTQNTGLATLYATGFTTIGAGGVNTIFFWPRPFNPILASTTNTTPYTYTPTLTFPQLASLQTIANGVRVVAAGIKVTSTASATQDSGAIVAGCLPRDNYAPTTVTTGTPAAAVVNLVTENGLPFAVGGGTVIANVGVNELANMEQTETFALRKGATIFFRPQDPNDFIFKNEYQLVNGLNAAGTVATIDDLQPSSPVLACGILSGTAAAPFMLEIVLHVEYTVGPFTAAVINTDRGSMTPDVVQRAADTVFGKATNLVREGITGGFAMGAGAIANWMVPGSGAIVGNLVNRAANYFTNSQNATTVVSRRTRQELDVDMVD